MIRLPIKKVITRGGLYLGLALAFLVACGMVTALAVHFTGTVPSFPLRWAALAGFTALTFWTAIKQYRRQWGQPALWLTVAGLLVFHLAVFAVVLLNYQEWRLVWFVPASLVEGWAIILILDVTLRHRG